MRVEIKTGLPQKNFRDHITLWLINALGLLLVSRMVKGIDFVASGWGELAAVLAASAALGLVNVALKPTLVLLTLPINILSLGLFTIVINALLLHVVAWLIPAFQIFNFSSALLGALLLSLISLFLQAIIFMGGFRVRIGK